MDFMSPYNFRKFLNYLKVYSDSLSRFQRQIHGRFWVLIFLLDFFALFKPPVMYLITKDSHVLLIILHIDLNTEISCGMV